MLLWQLKIKFGYLTKSVYQRTNDKQSQSFFQNNRGSHRKMKKDEYIIENYSQNDFFPVFSGKSQKKVSRRKNYEYYKKSIRKS